MAAEYASAPAQRAAVGNANALTYPGGRGRRGAPTVSGRDGLGTAKGDS
ncbi:hypothetical protein [Micromonospora parva]